MILSHVVAELLLDSSTTSGKCVAACTARNPLDENLDLASADRVDNGWIWMWASNKPSMMLGILEEICKLFPWKDMGKEEIGRFMGQSYLLQGLKHGVPTRTLVKHLILGTDAYLHLSRLGDSEEPLP
ncbi:hypothetical protein CK203_043705 [Vitis vinifera]|uniref:Uncharacterized protein n=1 Tax=Vitis vinifera TaxID=29760 RepID=A0A438GYL0_VITVI|nr:hypothetical protein CK203_043705 [Vitis vinifera]